MDIIVISNENRILHIINYGYEAHYIVYDCKLNTLTNGILESIYGSFDSYNVVESVIDNVREEIAFNSPFIYLYGHETDYLLRLIKFEKTKKNRNILNYIVSLYDKSDFFPLRREYVY